jgi:hypothetical protein
MVALLLAVVLARFIVAGPAPFVAEAFWPEDAAVASAANGAELKESVARCFFLFRLLLILSRRPALTNVPEFSQMSTQPSSNVSAGRKRRPPMDENSRRRCRAL